jgi:F5/8 type C domain/Bacterial Ig-like domain (group 2)/Right handed beta helix region
MPFKHKLSKRLALMKASLAASVVLTFACTNDLTDPRSPRNISTPSAIAADVTSLPIASAVASAYQSPNAPQNTLDNNFATRWSAYGDGQWIRYDLGAVMAIGPVSIAWYQGTTWASAFDIQVSPDTLTWTTVFSGRSSGQTLQAERYSFPAIPGRYVRIVGHGQWNGTTELSVWTSITEVAISGALVSLAPVAALAASGYQSPNAPQNTLDNNLATRWSSYGDGQWIRYDLGAAMPVGPVSIAWYQGTAWASAFAIQVSLDTINWTTVFSGRSSGQTLQAEFYNFPVVSGRYVRIVGHGQWNGTTELSLWNSITEVAIYDGPGGQVASAPVASVTVSPATGSVRVGATLPLAAVTKDSAGNPLTGRVVTWTSSNSAVATVSTSGVVTGFATGAATITATSAGTSGSAAITVTQVPVASVTVTPAIASLLAGATLQFTATLKDSAGNTLTGRSVTWASSAPAAATVSPVGFVNGLATGAVTISAASEGQSGSAALSVSGQTPLYTLGNGANYYVASTGSDANPCTPAAPCYTLGRVSQLMGPGDNAHVAPGNYTWSYSSNRVSKSGTATAPISYVSDTKWGAKIYGADCSPITNDGAYVQIINFDVTGSCVQGITTNGSYSKIIGNRVHDMPGTQLTAAIVGDCCSYASTGIQIIGNVIDNIGPWGQVNQTHGIYVASANAVVENNIVTRAASACIQTYHGATHLIISNNVVANCGRYGIQISADATVTINDYTTVNNNIIVNGGRYGIHEGYSLGSHIVYNNNIVYNNPAGNISGTTGVQSGTITLTSAQFSALFVHYTGDMTGDYHLQGGAVAIDAGTTSCALGIPACVPLFDLDGFPRPSGAAWDIGAYEWH